MTRAQVDARWGPARLSESDFQRRVLDAAQLQGWRAVHVRPARTERGWRTPYEGDGGLPDVILARSGAVILAELKGPRGRASAEQQLWLDQLGSHGRLWRPGDWDAVLQELR